MTKLKIINNISITKLQNYVRCIYCRFILFSNQQKYYHFTASNQTFDRYARIYQIHYIEYSVCIWQIHKTNVHPISIFYNWSIFSFLSLCVSKCVAYKHSIVIVNIVNMNINIVIWGGWKGRPTHELGTAESWFQCVLNRMR